MTDWIWVGEVIADVEQATFIFTFKNNSDQPILIEFPTSQAYDYTVYNAQGEPVYHFSKGRFFLQVIQHKSLNGGEQIQWKSTWNYKTNDGKRVPAGTYTVKPILTVWKINDKRVHSMPVTSFTFNIPPENTAIR
ncbi:hypothetical protein J5Y03_13005 [Bacillus sp. RG28]|uniref:Intracellular proteinase inhibitor BsuPI domain-containing protein n=1 Tax=Gottfriedia endophytica TaxID=2820819 RepID=A0A940SKJ5_9BACI|nr:BsuPI-related putative proteinase inhibitor [Gottfriedia endophytica]MBP0726094.1 hypothetical protein [Gottfriedia endophytica]